MAALPDWLRKNIPKATLGGVIGAASFAPDVAGVVTAEHKLTAITKALASIYFWVGKIFAPVRQALYGGWMILGFNLIGKAVQNLVKDTGSLEAALRRLQSIRGFERQFTPLLGGLSAAKTRVAELLALSQRGPFKFEEVATASKNLEVMTRGAMSGAAATRTIGQAAIATGNGINDVAEAVGQFYSTLRAGTPIEGAVEQLRQMGLVSNFTADQLDAMAQSGTPASVMFATLSDSIEKAHDSLREAGDDLKTVSAEHEKAAEEMKARFGAPWTQAEIQSTKNMTVAMTAVTPAFEAVSRSLAVVFTGFSTMGSAFARIVSQSSAVQIAIVAIGQALAVLSVGLLAVGSVLLLTALPALQTFAGVIGGGAAKALASWTLTAGIAARTGLILTGVLRGLSVVIVGGGFIGGLVTLAGIFVNVVSGIGKAINSLQEMRHAFNQGNDAIKQHIRTVQTVADQYEALSQAVNQNLTAQRKLQALQSGVGFTGSTIHRIMQLISAYREAHKARQTLDEARGIKGAITPEAQELARVKAQQARHQEEIDFQRQQAKAGPEAQIAGARQRAAVLGERAERGARGYELKAQLAQEEEEKQIPERLIVLEAKKAEAEKTLEDFKKMSPSEQERHVEIRKSAEKRLDEVKSEAEDLRKESSRIREKPEYAETVEGKQAAIEKLQRQEQLDKSITPEKQAQYRASILQLQVEEDILKAERDAYESNKDQSEELKTQAELRERSLRLEKIRAQSELETARATGSPGERAQKEFEINQRRIQAEQAEITRLPAAEQNKERLAQLQAELTQARTSERERIRGQVVTRFQVGLETAGVQARLAGRGEEAKTAEHVGNFVSKFEQLRQQFGDAEAKKIALQQEQNEIAKEGAAIVGHLKPVADSLARIGGGGGVGGPTGDPRLIIEQRQLELQKAANQYLAAIEQELRNQGAPPEEEGGGEAQPTEGGEGAAAPAAQPPTAPAVAPAVAPPAAPAAAAPPPAIAPPAAPASTPAAPAITPPAAPAAAVAPPAIAPPAAPHPTPAPATTSAVTPTPHPEPAPTPGEAEESTVQKGVGKLITTLPAELVKFGTKASIVTAIGQELINPEAVLAKTLTPEQQIEVLEKGKPPGYEADIKKLKSQIETEKKSAAFVEANKERIAKRVAEVERREVVPATASQRAKAAAERRAVKEEPKSTPAPFAPVTAAAPATAAPAPTPAGPARIPIPFVKNLPAPKKQAPGIRPETLQALGIDPTQDMSHIDWGFVKQFQDNKDREAASVEGRVAAAAPPGYDYNLGTGEYVPKTTPGYSRTTNKAGVTTERGTKPPEEPFIGYARTVSQSGKVTERGTKPVEPVTGFMSTTNKAGVTTTRGVMPSVSISAPGTTMAGPGVAKPIDASSPGGERYFTPGAEVARTLKDIRRDNQESNVYLNNISTHSDKAGKSL